MQNKDNVSRVSALFLTKTEAKTFYQKMRDLVHDRGLDITRAAVDESQDRLDAVHETIKQALSDIHEQISQLRGEILSVREELSRWDSLVIQAIRDVISALPPPQVVVKPADAMISVESAPPTVHVQVPPVAPFATSKKIVYGASGRPERIEETTTPGE